MSGLFLTGATLVLPEGEREGLGLHVEADRIAAILPHDRPPPGARVVALDGGALWPGFIDTQVNGGGGALFNADPSVEAIATMAAAHARHGTTGLLPTLITDDLDKVAAAIAAVDDAIAAGVPGVLGVHLEGPFLNVARKGVHDAAKFRVIDEAAITLFSSLKRGVTLVTLAPETAPPGAIAALRKAGVVVAAGHTDAEFDAVQAAFAEGLTGFTHLYNAMSPLGARAPGAVGAAMAHDAAIAGIIVDGVHVHPAALRVALKAMGPDRLMLVTDAMATAGTDMASFTLDGRVILAKGQTCWTPDGVLAGSNLTMDQAVANARSMLDQPSAAVARMAATTPARFLGLSATHGAIRAGGRADLVHLDAGGAVAGVWQGGAAVAAFP
jgi:N-acetylglucosamine-6-phosphate deacetylase